ncbi:manganese ABC transporter substrate-binding protein [Alkalihalobacillus alcalophilus ATCC 27647 = CGMCC 1.3604]|uniref:Manganese ABC transporter substrate-binding protein n=1 Tax=Alkalihalobacillus alcalophilus ATCC 27647 = CGMCC 1.3604 TaxID=1218173 RepID=A0A094YS31_ALKAL|nr:metal ABC transporter substrate-binding protein [Alkalihalobacillus alcalophilus]KGA96267.1 manganese ABC transporter substrate-binding protein [Alkalihalobacillus alcalophilus ATCC 27647 = CGMCC 1.3604]MED1563597.1 metal ABC transporter substrate-binding protein [Alkalihalobacillus alcalophilus]THG89558.1 manganese ABC transporter substrate-binding protein [Alkalihalobacillus alcalophilus ATCC 27647 = CGMCC 1.3604]
MRNLLFITTILTLFLLGACGSKPTGQEESTNQKLEVVTTYSIIYDITKNVGGDIVEIYNLTPIGADPHEYDPLPEDVKKTTDADVVFYNGLNLEEGNGWFRKLIEVAGKGDEDAPVYLVSEGVVLILLESQGLEEEADPHAWLDLRNGITYTENIRDALIKEDPENESIYVENATQYIQELSELHEKAIESIATIDENKRFLITSEGAFKYFGAAYDIETGYIWEINSENQGSPQQMRDVIDLVRDKGITSLFIETSVDRRTMDTVSQETGVPIVGTVYTDSLGKAGTDGDTYLKMMESNINVIIEGLSK